MSNISEQDVHKALCQIMHPVIDCSIVKLGIIRNITIKNNIAMITMAFPFLGVPAEEIPVRNQIINNVKQLVENIGLKFQLEQTEMTPEEFETFLAIEKKSWKDITDE